MWEMAVVGGAVGVRTAIEGLRHSLRQCCTSESTSGESAARICCTRPMRSLVVTAAATGEAGEGGRKGRQRKANIGGKLEWLGEPQDDPDEEIILRTFRQHSRETNQQILFDTDFLLKHQNRYQLVLEIAEDASEWMKSPEGKKSSLHTNAVYRQIIEKRKSLDPEYRGVEYTELESLQQIAKKMAVAARGPSMVRRDELEEMLKKAMAAMDVSLEEKVRDKLLEMDEEELDEIEWE